MITKESLKLSPSITFQSIDWIQLIAAGSFLIIGFINWIVFGIETGRYVELGSVFSFQGYSYFYFIGLYPLLLGIGLLIKVGVQWRTIILTSEQNQLKITEQRGWIKSVQCIDLKMIQKIHITNFLLSRRAHWILGLAPYLIICLNFGIPNLFLINLSGSILPGSIILGSGIICLELLIILLVNRETLVQIQVPVGFYELFLRTFNPQIEQQIHKFFFENVIIFHDTINPSHEIGIYRFDRRKFEPTQEFIIGLIIVLVSGYNTLLIPTLFSFQGEIISRIGLFLGFYLLIKSVIVPLECKFDIDSSLPLKSSKFKHESPIYDIWIDFNENPTSSHPRFCLPNISRGMWIIISVMLFWISFNIIRIIVGTFINPIFWWRSIINILESGIIFFVIFRIFIRIEYAYQFEGISSKTVQKSIIHLPSHKYLFKQFFGRVYKVQFSKKEENIQLKRRYWYILAISICGILFFLLDFLL